MILKNGQLSKMWEFFRVQNIIFLKNHGFEKTELFPYKVEIKKKFFTK